MRTLSCALLIVSWLLSGLSGKVCAATSPQACLAAVEAALEAHDAAAFERHVDMDGILDVVVKRLVEEASRPENAASLPPVLSLMLSGAALSGDGGASVRALLRNEARAFVRNGITSGAFAGHSSPEDSVRQEGLVAPLFRDASQGRKQIHGLGQARRVKNGWVMPFRVRDHGNGNDYAVVGRFTGTGDAVRLTGIEKLKELLARIREEAAQLEESPSY